MKTIYHKPVMLEEATQGLNIDPNGIYVDVTFGGGVTQEQFSISFLNQEDYLLLIRMQRQLKTILLTNDLN